MQKKIKFGCNIGILEQIGPVLSKVFKKFFSESYTHYSVRHLMLSFALFFVFFLNTLGLSQLWNPKIIVCSATYRPTFFPAPWWSQERRLTSWTMEQLLIGSNRLRADMRLYAFARLFFFCSDSSFWNSCDFEDHYNTKINEYDKNFGQQIYWKQFQYSNSWQMFFSHTINM